MSDDINVCKLLLICCECGCCLIMSFFFIALPSEQHWSHGSENSWYSKREGKKTKPKQSQIQPTYG